MRMRRSGWETSRSLKPCETHAGESGTGKAMKIKEERQPAPRRRPGRFGRARQILPGR
jgi:hypothetical protein